jgi:hypothetical protein
MNTITMNGFEGKSIATLEAISLSNCLMAYAKYYSGYEILEIGFNKYSGYVYIALEDEPIQICSRFGQNVEYCVYDFEDGEEVFYDSYEEIKR